MRIRALDADGDWLFGKGQSDYFINQDAIAQDIKCRLLSFLGDCFFATNEGIDWWNLLGSKNQLALELAVRATILNTDGVTRLVDSNVVLDRLTRAINMSYTIETIYTLNGITGPIISQSSFLLTEDGSVLLTEGGDAIQAG